MENYSFLFFILAFLSIVGNHQWTWIFSDTMIFIYSNPLLIEAAFQTRPQLTRSRFNLIFSFADIVLQAGSLGSPLIKKVAKGGPKLPAKLRMMSVLNVLNIFKKILARISAFIWLNLIGWDWLQCFSHWVSYAIKNQLGHPTVWWGIISVNLYFVHNIGCVLCHKEPAQPTSMLFMTILFSCLPDHVI